MGPTVQRATYRRHLPARPHLRRPASLYRRSGLRAHSVRRPALHLGAHSGPDGLHHHQRPWASATRSRVHGKYASDWPLITRTGRHQIQQPEPDATYQHLLKVCMSPPQGFPKYARLGGPYTQIALRFKADRMRNSSMAGLPHDVRCPCLWCGVPDSECGIHLLECRSAPAGLPDRVDQLLRSIYDESSAPRTVGLWTRKSHDQALTYTRKPDWPNITASTLQAALRTIGGLLSHYRRAWTGYNLYTDPNNGTRLCTFWTDFTGYRTVPVGVIVATCTMPQSLPALSRTFPKKLVRPGKLLTYRIRFRSTNKVNALTGLTAVVALPAGVSVLQSTTTPYPVRRNKASGVGTVSNSAITWQNLTIPAMGVRKFSVRMRVNQDVPSGTVLSFGCTLSQTNASPNGDPYCSQQTQNAAVSVK